MKGWWHRYAGWLAILFASLTVTLIVVVAVQAVMLHSRGWRLVMGSVPEWVSAGFAAVTAFGVLAAFATLRIAQIERREQLANQALLIIVETVPRAELVWPANEHPDRPDMQPEYRYAVIRNRSQEPIFNVRIHRDPPKQPSERKQPQRVTVAEVVPQDEARGSFTTSTPHIVHNAHPRLVPVLAPGQATFQVNPEWVPRDEQVTEYVYFTFTDARGARWARLGSELPQPLD